MKFINRLKYYAIGVGFGCLLVYFFFGNRSCSGWLPGNRVKSAIFEFPLMESEHMSCLMQKVNFNYDSLALLIKDGEVNFSQSEVKTSPRVYQIANKDKVIKIAVDFQDSLVYLKNILGVSTDDCEQLDKHFDQSIGKALEDFILKKSK